MNLERFCQITSSQLDMLQRHPTSTKLHAKECLEPTQTPKMGLFAKIINYRKP